MGAFIAGVVALIVVGRCLFTQMAALLHIYIPLMLWCQWYESQNAGVTVTERKLSSLGGAIVSVAILAVLASLHNNFSFLRSRYALPDMYKTLSDECTSHPQLNYYTHVFFWASCTIPTGSFLSEDYKGIRNLLPDQDFLYLAPSVQKELELRGIPGDLNMLLQENSRFICIPASYPHLELKMKYWKEHHGYHLRAEKVRDITDGIAIYKVIRESEPNDDSPRKPDEDNRAGE